MTSVICSKISLKNNFVNYAKRTQPLKLLLENNSNQFLHVQVVNQKQQEQPKDQGQNILYCSINSFKFQPISQSVIKQAQKILRYNTKKDHKLANLQMINQRMLILEQQSNIKNQKKQQKTNKMKLQSTRQNKIMCQFLNKSTSFQNKKNQIKQIMVMQFQKEHFVTVKDYILGKNNKYNQLIILQMRNLHQLKNNLKLNQNLQKIQLKKSIIYSSSDCLLYKIRKQLILNQIEFHIITFNFINSFNDQYFQTNMENQSHFQKSQSLSNQPNLPTLLTAQKKQHKPLSQVSQQPKQQSIKIVDNLQEEKVFINICQYLRNKGIEFKTMQHEATRTSQQSANIRKTPLEWGSKTMIVTSNDNQLVLLIYRAHRKVSWKKIRKIQQIGKKAQMATQNQVIKLGVKPGGVPPLPNMIGIKGILDQKFKQVDMMAFNAGHKCKSIIMKTADFPLEDISIGDITDD